MLEASTISEKLGKKRDVHLGDRLFFHTLRIIALCIIFLLGAIAFQLLDLSLPTIKKFGLGFLWGTNWDPVNDFFGAAPFIYGTIVSSFIGLIISTPISVGVALFLTEVAPYSIAKYIALLVEMLAAIPSVIYGLWGIFVLAPWLRVSLEPFLQKYFGFFPLFQGTPYGVGMLAAGIILAIMITPTISAICREIFQAVPLSQREAARALGATRWETIRLAVFQSSKLGVFGAVTLGLGRALGETMAVTMVIGNRNEIAASLFAPGQTMASLIANEYSEASNDIHLSALATVGLSLFLVSLVINIASRYLVQHFKAGRVTR